MSDQCENQLEQVLGGYGAEFPTGRKFVMGDIHGGARALAQVLARAEFDFKNDILIQLGDVADGWSETYDCVEQLLKVDNLISLRGNHDLSFNQWLITRRHPYSWDQGALETLKSYCVVANFELKATSTTYNSINGEATAYIVNAYPELVPESHREFFRKQLKKYVDADNNIYVHAGFDRHRPFNEQEDDLYYWDRKLWNQALSSVSSQNGLKFADPDINEIFIGHTTTTGWDMDAPIKADKIWNMDTGAGFDGRLSMMEVNTKELFQSDPVMELYPKNWGDINQVTRKKHYHGFNKIN